MSAISTITSPRLIQKKVSQKALHKSHKEQGKLKGVKKTPTSSRVLDFTQIKLSPVENNGQDVPYIELTPVKLSPVKCPSAPVKKRAEKAEEEKTVSTPIKLSPVTIPKAPKKEKEEKAVEKALEDALLQALSQSKTPKVEFNVKLIF